MTLLKTLEDVKQEIKREKFTKKSTSKEVTFSKTNSNTLSILRKSHKFNLIQMVNTLLPHRKMKLKFGQLIRM